MSNEIDAGTKASLRKALTFNYWTVEDGLTYLTRINKTRAEKYYFQNGLALTDIAAGEFGNYAKHTDKHNYETTDKLTRRFHELKAIWRDTDHTTAPRDDSVHPNDNQAEFTTRYFISWALSRKIEIYWLDWARNERLVSADLHGLNNSKLDYRTALTKLLARNYWTVDEGTDYLARSNANLDHFERPENDHDAESILYYELRIEYEQLWYDTDHNIQARANHQLLHSGFGEYPVHYFISWALSRGVAVPWLSWAIEQRLVPDLAEVKSIKLTEKKNTSGKYSSITSTCGTAHSEKISGPSKGGQARAAITKGAKEACRTEAKALRQGKPHAEKLTLDECANFISEVMRDEIEGRHNVTLPSSARTIRGYLQTKAGDIPV